MTTVGRVTPTAASRPPRTSRTRLPLNTFGMAFGLAGLAGTWTAATTHLGAAPVVSELIWALAAIVWLSTVVRYAMGVRAVRDLVEDLRHPVLGPFAALVPTVGSLLAAHASRVAPAAATVVVDVMAVLALGILALFVADLLTRPRDVAQLHGGYLLPTVAASLVAAQSLATVGQVRVATAAFAVGVLFWLLIGAVLLGRFATGPALPSALLPTLAIFSAPPAVAGNAWWVLQGPGTSLVHDLLVGTMLALLAPHLVLARRYLRLPFAIGSWALTFTAASSATYALHLVARDSGAAATVVGWLLVAAATLLVGTIAVRTLMLVRPLVTSHVHRTR
ncbi:C4-dicarboxylate transporter [Cellulosimicrobium cellulans]|uniref:SLAC1 family transporter n=1 Tax=Cellulosimicrobium cellulans TaxID=1710 RepID=UPI0009F1F10A|nr:C4-dicarboxylate transporter [Cellulosimicrobium cellulans]